MNDVVPPVIQPPASSSIRNVAALLSGGRFVPASVQRSFEWEVSYASQLLNDIDKALARLQPDADAATLTEQDQSEAKAPDTDASDATSVAAPADDFAFDEAAKEMAIAARRAMTRRRRITSSATSSCAPAIREIMKSTTVFSALRR
jgi:cysteinyl-tRNA synthetase